MDRTALQTKLETPIRQQAQRDRNVRNAYLLVRSESLGESTSASRKEGREIPTRTYAKRSTWRASASSTPPRSSRCCTKHDSSAEIHVRHLLNQTSGLADCLWPLLEQLKADPTMTITPREAVTWGKENLQPRAKPGTKHHDTDTNYYLLGLIVESITHEPFHASLHRRIVSPLGVDSAYMQGYSGPAAASPYPAAHRHIDDIDNSDMPGFARIDYAGGGVVVELADHLTFLRVLVDHELVSAETLERMKSDEHPSYPGMRYGYAIWKSSRCRW